MSDMLSDTPVPRSGRHRRSQWLVYALLIAFAATTLFPFVWIVGAAFKPKEEIIGRPLQLLPDPRKWRLSSELREGDVIGWPAFCAQVAEGAGGGEPGPDGRIWALMDGDGRQAVAACSAGTATPREVAGCLDALNAVLARGDFYDETAFSTVAVPDEAKDLMVRARSAPLNARRTMRLNRLLLEAAFPLEIRRAIGPFDNFRRALSVVPFARFFLNSLMVALVVTIGQVATSACAAYAFARLRFPGRDRIFLGYLATLMVPWTVVMIPTFVMLKAFGWIDTYWALTVPAMFSAYGTFMLRQFFLGIPREYEEAAKIDGCGHVGIFLHVILPLSKPALATLGLFTFIGSWNNLIAPLVFIVSEEKMTLPLGLTRFQGLHATDWGALMAGSLMMLMPMLVLFAVGQRFFTRGIRLTRAKG